MPPYYTIMLEKLNNFFPNSNVMIEIRSTSLTNTICVTNGNRQAWTGVQRNNFHKRIKIFHRRQVLSLIYKLN